MKRNNEKLKLPWVGKIEKDNYYVIRNIHNNVVAIVPPHIIEQKNIGGFIVRTANNKAIRDITIRKLENIALIFGLVTLSLVTITILVDIDYSPMLILSGGVLTTLSYIYLTRMKIKS